MGLDSNNKEDATVKARQLGVGVGKRAELANLLSLMSEDDIGDMREGRLPNHDSDMKQKSKPVLKPRLRRRPYLTLLTQRWHLMPNTQMRL